MKKFIIPLLFASAFFLSCKTNEPVEKGTVSLDVTTISTNYNQTFKITPVFRQKALYLTKLSGLVPAPIPLPVSK